MKRKAALIDIDGTIYDGFTIMDLALDQQKTGFLSDTTISKLFSIYEKYKSGTVPYEETAHMALIAWGHGLKNQRYNDIEAHTKAFFDAHHKLHSFAPKLVDILEKKGYDSTIVTGEPQFIGEYFTEKIDAQYCLSSVYEVDQGTFTGKTLASLGTREGKREAIKSLHISLSKSVSFGDSEGDIDMLELTDIPFCVNPSKSLQRVADERGWIVVNEKNILERVELAI